MTILEQGPAKTKEAVGVAIATLSEDPRAEIDASSESELIGLHFGLRGWIPNNPGLWSGNRRLLKGPGKRHANEASMANINAVWQRPGEMVPKVH